MNRRLHLYWFSGSGNTLRAADVFAERLCELKWTVELRSLERSDPQKIDPTAALGLAFPTHCFTIPKIVLTFVRSLSHVKGSAAMMLGTHGAFSGGVVGPMKKELTRKGFHCIAARILSMPDSFFPLCSNTANQRKTECALERAKQYAEDFAAERCRWSRLPILCDLYAGAVGWLFAARKWSHHYFTTVHVNAERCNRCGVCVRACPVSALTDHESNDPPKPNKHCTNCLRCVAVCPTDAMRHMMFQPYRSEEAAALIPKFVHKSREHNTAE